MEVERVMFPLRELNMFKPGFSEQSFCFFLAPHHSKSGSIAVQPNRHTVHSLALDPIEHPTLQAVQSNVMATARAGAPSEPTIFSGRQQK
jgi:hypothetical protein